ncbi:hypothetical protein R4I97_08900 [Brachyspira pilosicoli]|uniref:hypothetical protein n=1 Tax=Brachyspira pilosicoli TaxID=52584 RepID=UPI003007634F
MSSDVKIDKVQVCRINLPTKYEFFFGDECKELNEILSNNHFYDAKNLEYILNKYGYELCHFAYNHLDNIVMLWFKKI